LSTIVPVASPYLGVDFPMRNNIASAYWIKWLTLVSGRTSQDQIFWHSEAFWGAAFRRWFESGAPFKALDRFLGNPSDIFQEWLSHPYPDEHWDRLNPTAEQYSQTSMPVLTITGACDDDQACALMHYTEHLRSVPEAHRAQHYLIIGPWDHAGTRVPRTQFLGLQVGAHSLLDLRQLHLEWYRWTMLGGPKPRFLQDRVAYYVMGADEWRYADSLESITSRTLMLYLASHGNPSDVFCSGSMTAGLTAGTGPDQFVYDPRDVSQAELESTLDPECRADERMIHARAGKHLVYHSAPFESDVEVSGFFKVTVWLSIDQPDTDFLVAIYLISGDGRSTLLTNDLLRARFREDFRNETLVHTKEPLRYDFTRFAFVSHRVVKHSRLRLVIGPINSIYSEKNHNSGGVVAEESIEVARAVTVRLFHDHAHPSVVQVPIGRPDSGGGAVP